MPEADELDGNCEGRGSVVILSGIGGPVMGAEASAIPFYSVKGQKITY